MDQMSNFLKSLERFISLTYSRKVKGRLINFIYLGNDGDIIDASSCPREKNVSVKESNFILHCV